MDVHGDMHGYVRIANSKPGALPQPFVINFIFPLLIKTSQRNTSLIQAEPQHELWGDTGAARP